MGPNGGSLTMERSFDGRQSRDNSTVCKKMAARCWSNVAWRGGDAIYETAGSAGTVKR
jgi:hypothetical protein